MSDTPHGTTDGPESPRRRLGARLTTIVGIAFALGGLAFVVQRISASWDETSDALAGAQLGWMALAVGLAAAGMTAIAVPWPDVVEVLGARLDRVEAVLLYFVGEIGKYLPGGVWPVVGRGELAHKAGLARTVAYTSVLFSLAVLYLAALLLAAALFPFVLSADGSSSAPALLLLLVPVGLVCLHPAVLGRVIALGARVTRREFSIDLPSWGAMAGLVLRYVPAWLLIGTSTWAVARGLQADVGWAEVCVATVLSWSAGFLVAPAPGGVGVREAAFVAVATSFPAGIGAATALSARLIFMVVDAGGAAACGAVLGARRRSSS